MKQLAVLLCLAPTAGLAECPPVANRTADLASIIDAARAAPNELEGRTQGAAMWEIFLDAPDEPAQALLDKGLAAIRVADYVGALDALGRLIEYCPDYSEGWNQRAFAHYLSGNYEDAVPDLEKAIDLNPVHVGALSGLALTLIALGREDEAQGWLATAVDLNPWISERRLLKTPPGSEL